MLPITDVLFITVHLLMGTNRDMMGEAQEDRSDIRSTRRTSKWQQVAMGR